MPLSEYWFLIRYRLQRYMNRLFWRFLGLLFNYGRLSFGFLHLLVLSFGFNFDTLELFLLDLRFFVYVLRRLLNWGFSFNHRWYFQGFFFFLLLRNFRTRRQLRLNQMNFQRGYVYFCRRQFHLLLHITPSARQLFLGGLDLFFRHFIILKYVGLQRCSILWLHLFPIFLLGRPEFYRFISRPQVPSLHPHNLWLFLSGLNYGNLFLFFFNLACFWHLLDKDFFQKQFPFWFFDDFLGNLLLWRRTLFVLKWWLDHLGFFQFLLLFCFQSLLWWWFRGRFDCYNWLFHWWVWVCRHCWLRRYLLTLGFIRLITWWWFGIVRRWWRARWFLRATLRFNRLLIFIRFIKEVLLFFNVFWRNIRFE